MCSIPRSEISILSILDSENRRLPEPFVIIKAPQELNDSFADLLRKTVFAPSPGHPDTFDITIHGWDYSIAFGPRKSHSIEISRSTAMRIKREYGLGELLSNTADNPGTIWGDPDESFLRKYEGFFSGHRKKTVAVDSAPRVRQERTSFPTTLFEMEPEPVMTPTAVPVRPVSRIRRPRRKADCDYPRLPLF